MKKQQLFGLNGKYFIKAVTKGKLNPVLKIRIKGNQGKTYFLGFFQQFFKIPCMSFVLTVKNSKTLVFTYANGELVALVTRHKRHWLGRMYVRKVCAGLFLITVSK